MSSSPPSMWDLRIEILILSSFLDGQQSFPSTPHPRDTTLDLYSNISTLLAIGNSWNPRAQNVNAVMGTINIEPDATALEFLVCVENTRQTAPNDEGLLEDEDEEEAGGDNKEDKYPEAGNKADKYGDLKLMFPLKRAARVERIGRELLDKWNGKTMKMEEMQEENDFTFTTHLRHLFHVISAIDVADPLDLQRFQHFIHHRAYRKLGYRVLDFAERWGISPFDILLQNLDPGLEPETFQLPLDKSFRIYLGRFGLVELPRVPECSSRAVFTINSTNALQWGNALVTAWDRLQKEVLDSTKTDERITYEVKMELPTNGRVMKIVVWVKVLENLLNPVLRYLALSPRVGKALAEAELDTYRRRVRGVASKMGEDPDLEFAFPDDLSNLHGNPVDRLLQGMRTIVAWQASSRYIFGEARSLRNRGIMWKLSQFQYHSDAVQSELLDMQTVAYVLEKYRGEALALGVIKKVMHRTRTAKVHAEASLMHWIATVRDVDSINEWPIGVSKKCCYVCWLLHLQYNRVRNRKFVLPGTHGAFYAWLPPPGLSQDMLVYIKNELVVACKNAVLCHSRHSSVSSALSDTHSTNDEPSGEELESAMPLTDHIHSAGGSGFRTVEM